MRGFDVCREIGESVNSTKEVIPVKQHISEEIGLTSHSSTNADPTIRRQSTGLRPLLRPKYRKATTLGDFAAVVALSIAFFSLLFLSLRAVQQPSVAQGLEVPQRPIWISTVPFAPRDGVVPDIGLTNRGTGQRATVN
jgi:hypothetical protein